MKRLILICLATLLFAFAGNTNATVINTLVYDGGGPESVVQQAMTDLGIAFDLRGPGNPVTAADLASHNLLVIGWNYAGDMSGLDPDVLEDGITGKKLLTGHDADWHSVHGYDSGPGGDAVDAAATKFLSQAISFARGSRTGLVALADYSTAFSYLPSEWGISAVGGLSKDTIDLFTNEGIASGVYNGLTPADMSNWGASYHASFTGWGDQFVPFEIGGDTMADMVTIATPEPATICILGLGALAMVRRKQQ